MGDLDSVETELTDGELSLELVHEERDLVGDVVKVHLDSELLLVVLHSYPEANIDCGGGNHVVLGELRSEISEVEHLELKLYWAVLSVGGNHAWQHDVEIGGGQSEVKWRWKNGLVVPSMATLGVQVGLKEGIESLHAHEHLELIKMSHVLEWHDWESDSVVVSNSLIEEQSLDSDGEGVKRDLSSNWSDNIEHHVWIVEVEVSVGGSNGLVDGKWEGNVNGLLVGGLNELDHWSLEEANEGTSELRPDISVKVNLDILLTNEELNVNSLDGWEGAAIEHLLGHELNTNLELKSLELNIGVSLCLDEAFLELEVTTVESGSKVISLKYNGIIFDIIVEINKFVVL